MNSQDLGILTLVGFFLLGDTLIAIGTIRKNRWGIPFQKVDYCPDCGNPIKRPRRVPKTLSQHLWGGVTCDECGTDVDKWGRAIRQRLSPSELAAIKDHFPERSAAAEKNLFGRFARWLIPPVIKPDQPFRRRFLSLFILFGIPGIVVDFFQLGGLKTPLTVLPVWLVLEVPINLLSILGLSLPLHLIFLWYRKQKAQRR